MKCRCSCCVHNYASRCLLLERQIKGIAYRIPNFRKCPYFKLG